MDMFEYDSVKAEKDRAMLHYHRLRALTKLLFCSLELLLALTLLVWAYNHLPFAVKISGQFLHRLGGIVASPLFVFLLSNAIIAGLFAAKSYGENLGANSAEGGEMFEEMIRNSGNCSSSIPRTLTGDDPCPDGDDDGEKNHPEVNEIVFQDKEVILSEQANAVAAASLCDSDSEPGLDNPRIYRRTKSEKPRRARDEELQKKLLRRSETEKCYYAGKKIVAEDRGGENLLCPEAELTDEEFQRAVDEFIAKNLRFRRQECMAVVLQNQSPSSVTPEADQK